MKRECLVNLLSTSRGGQKGGDENERKQIQSIQV